MSITATLYHLINFGGFSVTADSGNVRYHWNKYGSTYNWNIGSAHNQFSSMWAFDNGNRGSVYAFEHIDFNGRFASLNVGGKFSSAWWSWLGSDFNVISSLLIVARAPQDRESEVALRDQVTSQFTAIFDQKVKGKPVSRSGNPRMYATFFPSYDPDKVFATIEQKLTVQVRIPLKTRIKIWNPFGKDIYITIDLGKVRWSDYTAWVQYDIRFFLNNGILQGVANWARVTVEPGPLSQMVYDDLAPPLFDAMKDFTAAVQSALQLFSRQQFAGVYLLPGRPPNMDLAGQKGNYDDDVTLVVVKI